MRFKPGVVACWLVSLVLGAPALEGQIPIHGSVTGSAGSVEGVEVTLHPLLAAHEDALLLLAGSEEAEPIAVSRTDSSGRFRLVAPGPGMWRVRAEREGMAPMALDLVPLVEELELPDLRLSRAGKTRIEVRSATGEPVSGARVLLTTELEPARYDGFSEPAWARARQLGITGLEGYTDLEVSDATAAHFEVVAAGFLPHGGERLPPRSSTVRLHSAEARTIEILDPRGAPAEGVAVWLGGLRQPLGVTDQSGRLAVPVGSEEARLRLVAADGAALEAALDRKPNIEQPQPDRFRLSPQRIIEGRVIGLPDRHPVTEALVWREMAPAGVARTDGHGVYRLGILPWDQGRLNTAAPGYLPEKLPPPADREAWLSVGPTVVLHRGTAIFGVVLDSDELPLPGAEVRTRFDRRALGPLQVNVPYWQRQTGAVARAAENGRFRLGNLAPGLEYELRVELEGYAPERLTVPAPNVTEPGEEVRIVLQRGARVTGLVVGPERQPVAGAQVTLEEAKPGDVLEQARRVEDPLPRLSSITDPEGRFQVGPLPPVTVDLEVEAPGYASLTVRGLDVENGGDEPVDLGTVVLSPEAAVRGRIVGPEDEPLAGAAVTIVPEEALLAVIQDRQRPAAAAFSGSDGEFELGGLRKGEQVKLRVDLEGYGLEVVSAARAGGEPILVRLERARSLGGRVVDSDGMPVAGALVQVDPLDYLELAGGQIPSAAKRTDLWAEAGADGRFRVEGLTPGLLEVVVTAGGWQRWQRRLDPWRDGGEGSLDVVLKPAAVVSGVVLDASGQPAIGAEIRRWAPPLPEGTIFYEAPLATTDGDGRYRIDDLAPGRARLEARHGGLGRAVRELEATAGEHLLDFQLEAAATVSGVVVDRFGSPVSGAQVVVRAPLASWVPPRIVSDGAGAFEIRGLAAGRYTLDAVKRGVGRSVESVGFELQDDSMEGLVLEIAPTGTVTGRLFGLAPEELSSVRIHAGPLMDVGTIDYEGSYRIADLQPGAWTIVAEVSSTGRRAMGRIDLDPEDPDGYLDLDLGSGFTLSGVVALDGEPWPRSRVTAYGPGGVSAGTETDERGLFYLSGLSSGDYLIEVLIPGRDVRHQLQLTIDADQRLSIEVRSGLASGSAGGQGADEGLDF